MFNVDYYAEQITEYYKMTDDYVHQVLSKYGLYAISIVAVTIALLLPPGVIIVSGARAALLLGPEGLVPMLLGINTNNVIMLACYYGLFTFIFCIGCGALVMELAIRVAEILLVASYFLALVVTKLYFAMLKNIAPSLMGFVAKEID